QPTAPASRALLSALRALAEHGRIDGVDWKPWFEDLPENLRTNTDALRLLVAVGDRRGPALAPRLLQRGPQSLDVCLAAAIAAFEQEHPTDAYVHLQRAFELDPAAALHTVIRDWNNPFTEVLKHVGKEDEFADWLGNRYAQCPGVNLVPSQPAPEA